MFFIQKSDLNFDNSFSFPQSLVEFFSFIDFLFVSSQRSDNISITHLGFRNVYAPSDGSTFPVAS